MPETAVRRVRTKTGVQSWCMVQVGEKQVEVRAAAPRPSCCAVQNHPVTLWKTQRFPAEGKASSEQETDLAGNPVLRYSY